MSNPLLILPKQNGSLNRTGLKSAPIPKLFHPNINQQASLFDLRINNLDRAFSNESVDITSSIEGLEAERILVLEIKGSIDDFYKAVGKTEGMEFLREIYLGEDEPDEIFHFENSDNKVSRKLFLTINNYQAIAEFKRYWKWYKYGERFKQNTTKFRNLFEQLNDVRYYSVKDRYEDTGIKEYFEERLEFNEEELYFEIELTYRKNDDYLRLSYENVKCLIENCGGLIIEGSHVIIKEIKYHAVIAKAPITLFNSLTENTDIPFFKCDQIMYFRPVGQSVKSTKNENISSLSEDFIQEAQHSEIQSNSVVALLDGLPLQNHVLLQDKLIIDDPLNIESLYPSAARAHGTAMASLILYGDLNSSSVNLISRKLYVRPILTFLYDSYHNTYEETVPKDKLFIDIIHSAVKRIFEGDGNNAAVAPQTKIINFSIGDPYRQFIYSNSSWARMIDWLSYKYNVLFIISAGNYINNINLDLGEQQFESFNDTEKEKLFFKHLINTELDRRIIAPAESINSITVGAIYNDEYEGEFITNNSRVELSSNRKQISPISRTGLGYLRSIKPDILMNGGRQLYRKYPLNNSFSIESFNNAPGQKVACSDTNNTNKGVDFTRGTSNATALATRFGAKIHQVLENLNFENLSIPNEYFSVLIKALIVHGASKENTETFSEILGNSSKKKLLSYIGHGLIHNEEKVLSCTEQQVTVVGYGTLTKDKSHLFEFPLPSEISAIQISKQLTITLAWISPLNFDSNKYRKSVLYVDNITGTNSINTDVSWDNGNEYDYRASTNGSVQHLRYKGTGADAYIEDSTIKIKINCREFAPKLDEHIRYGLAVTFELLNESEINIYNEIKERIAQRIRVNTP